MEDRMRKLTIAAAALVAAACFSGNASALTGSYADGVKASSEAVKVAYCYRGCYGCCRRVYVRTCGCGCGGWGGGGGFFGIF
jgi:hypothetical protein